MPNENPSKFKTCKVYYLLDFGIISGDTQSGASVELKNNAIVTVQEAYIGYGQNVENNTILVGSNSTLRGNDDYSALYVGNWNGLNNSLVISGGGLVEYGETWIADRSSNVKVTGAGSTLAGVNGAGSEIVVGAFSGANNTLEVENGGTVISTNTIIADRTASNNNTITVNGTGSTYTASGIITVGDLGDNNTLSVINGGAVSTQNLVLGNTATAANNTATVSGAGSTITTTGSITVGELGDNSSLSVINGGGLSTQNLVLGSNSSSANNTATVSGAGSTITSTGNITVGGAGSGTLEILNGGNLSAGAIQIASQAGSKGVINVGTFGGNTTSGTLSAAAINFGSGNGTVNFNQSDNFTYAGNFTGGANTYPNRSLIQQLGSGTTTLIGTGSDAYAAVVAEAGRLVFDGAVFDLGIDLISGDTQSGATVELKNNAIVTVQESYIGYGQNVENNTILVGSNSTLRGNDEYSALYVGNWNGLNNSLVISGGGLVEYGETWIADRSSNVKVTGAGSTLAGVNGAGSEIVVGAFSGANNTLEVENGGRVISSDTIIADRTASNNNTITVNGTGSTYTASGNITVGDLGDNNTLSVINGGAVSTQNLLLGNTATAANNSATVSGAGSTITTTGNITVGNAGSGRLEILSGGNLTAGTIHIASQSGSTGTVNIGAFGGNTTGGTLTAGNISFGNGTGTLNFNQSGNATIAANITSLDAGGSVNQLGSGTTTLTGNNNYTGGTTVSAGTLAVNGMIQGQTTINNGGTLAGIGMVGDVVINSGGTIAPGNSPGTITTGNMAWNGGGIYNWQLGSVNGTAGTDWDLINSSGNLAINSTNGDKFMINAEALAGSGFDSAARSYKWKVANFGGGITGFSSDKFALTNSGFENLSGVYAFSFTSDANALFLNYATVAIWDAGTGNWTDHSNWVDDIAAINGIVVEYAGTNGTSTNNSGTSSIKSLTFTNTSTGSFTLEGGALTIGAGGIVNDSAHSNTIGLDLTLGANQTFATNTADLVVSGNISGTSSLTKTGNQTLKLTGNNNYSGGTTVNAGTLAGTTTSLQGAIANNAAVNFDQTTNGTYAGVMGGSGSLVKTGSGTVTLSGANNYTGGTTVNAGTLAGTTTSLQGAIANNAAVSFDQTTNGTYAGVMSGSGSLVKNGTGSLGLASSNNFSGRTILNAGRLDISNQTALGTSALDFNAGVLSLESGLTVSSFAWNSEGLFSLNNAGTNFLTVNGSFNLAGSTGNGSHIFDLRNFTLGVDPMKLVAFQSGITESDLNRFGIQNLSNYEFLLQEDALWVKLAALIVNGTTTIDQGSNLTYPLALFDPNSKLVIPGGSPSTTLNFAGNLTVTNNSTVMANGSLAIANPYVIIVDQGSTLAGSGNVTASKVIVNGQLGDTTSNGGMTIHGDLDMNNTGSYLWNLYANSANASRAGTDFSAPLTVNGTTTLTGNSTFSMYFDPTTVDYLNDFWDFNQSWVVMNGTTISGNLTPAFVANSASGFSANTFRITNNGTSLLLSYLAPRIDDPTDISPTGITDLPSYNSEPVKLVIDAPPTGTAVLANTNPSLTSIVLNSGSLISPTNTAIPENANVTVNAGAMGFQGDGVNYINGLLLTGGSLGTGGNTTVAVRSFLVTGGQLAGSGNATYWADNYLFQAVDPAKVDAKLGNLGTVSGFNSTALITTPITPGAASAPVVFDTSMLYTGNTTIAGGILQLGSGNSANINLAAGSSVALNNKDGYACVLNYGSNANRSIMDNVVTGNGTVGQVGTGTLTITDDGATAFAAFTGNFAAANGKLAFDDIANLGGATGFNLSSNGTLQVDTGVAALSQNLSVTSGTGIVDNNTGGTLALNGTLAKTGSVLVLTGGNFQINGAIVGNSGSFNSDMVYDAATATINVPGVYLGPTFVQGGSTVTSGVANALPTDTVLHVGVATDGAVTNTFNLSTFDQIVAGIASAGSASNIITSAGGDLTVNGAQSTTYNGLITGPLALTRAGSGSTTLGGANTYSGGTTINAGRIITTSASALGTGAVVLNGGALQVMQTLQIASLNWASNSAVIVLPNAYGTNAYLDVAGVITLGNPSGNTFDLTGTTLNGTPTKLLGSGVTALNAASFAATGVNPAYDYLLYTQGNDLWLRILSTEIEVSGPNSYTTINVNGAYTMSGALKIAETGGYSLQYGDQYLFLTATGGITGEYSSIDMPEKFRARLLLGNNNTTAKILVAPGTYTRVAITQNQKNAAKALDSFIPATSGDREAVSFALDLQTAGQYPYAFDQIAPGFYESLGDILIEQTYNQAQLLTQRLGSVRLGATGFQAIGMSQPIKYDKDGKSAADAKTASPIVESALDTNWNSWVIANGEFSLSRGLSGVPNYKNNAGGFLVGADYRLSENFAAGLFAGYEYSYAKYDGGSSTQGNSALFGLYGSYTHEDGYYADAIVSGGYTGFQTRRSIQFSTIDRTASADPNSGQFSAALNLGKDFEIGQFTLGPIIGAQYTYAGIGGFTETGADSLDLALGQQNADSLRTNLGARLAYNWEVGAGITLIPEVRGFWMHEFLNGPRNINSALDGGSGSSFDYETSAPYRNSVFGGAGISANFADRWSASVFYNVNFGGEGYTNNIISTSLGLSF